MRALFLGTNGWYDTKTGNTVCVLLETKNAYMIFDAGNGFCKIGEYIKGSKPVYLFLSHYHLDHVIGLHALNKFVFKQGMDVYGPKGLKTFFNNVINAPYSMPVCSLSTSLRLHEVDKPGLLPSGIEYGMLKHSTVCYGYRISADGKTACYCTDTGICADILDLARETDLFICECSYKKIPKDSNWPHLWPEQAARAARASRCKKLVLTHFDASIYLERSDRKQAQLRARKIFKNTIAANDGLSIYL